MVSVDSPTAVRYNGGQKAVNSVVVTRSARTVTIDDRVPIRAGKGCVAVKGDSTRVRCTTAQTPTSVLVFTYDYNDTIVNRSDLSMTANGGPGSDQIHGGPAADFLQGDTFTGAGAGNDSIWGYGGRDFLIGAGGDDGLNGGDGDDYLDTYIAGPVGGVNPAAQLGNDRLYGGNGNDWAVGGAGNDLLSGGAGGDTLEGGPGTNVLWGGDGNDSMTGGTGPDVFHGGPGTRDSVNYNGRSRPVTADLDGATGDDGETGERDTIGADVEWLYGGTGNDVLTGNAADNEIDGWLGDDVVRGGAGNDFLAGTQGHDKIYGEAGDDDLRAKDFEDSGTPDLADGGSGTDTCQADADDTVVRCETVS